ncbi:MAG: phosphodiester glycosidase family protein [Polyangiaceae bacterium]
MPRGSVASTPKPPPFPPPAAKPPLEASKAEGDGEWEPLPVKGLEPSPLAKTVLHPKAAAPSVAVYVVAMDLSRLTIGLAGGRDEPKSLVPPIRHPGLVPEAEIPRLVAITNGGFKRKHGMHGMKLGDDVYVPPLPNACTLAMTKDGAVKIATWTRLADEEPSLAWYRQNGPCLVEDGATTEASRAPFQGAVWGAAQEGDKDIRRSAYAISKDGKTLFFSIGDGVDPDTFARALVAAGAEAACQFDINFSFTRFVLLEMDDKGGFTAKNALMKNMVFAPLEGWKTHAERDFFYILKKP